MLKETHEKNRTNARDSARGKTLLQNGGERRQLQKCRPEVSGGPSIDVLRLSKVPWLTLLIPWGYRSRTSHFKPFLGLLMVQGGYVLDICVLCVGAFQAHDFKACAAGGGGHSACQRGQKRKFRLSTRTCE